MTVNPEQLVYIIGKQLIQIENLAAEIEHLKQELASYREVKAEEKI